MEFLQTWNTILEHAYNKGRSAHSSSCSDLLPLANLIKKGCERLLLSLLFFQKNMLIKLWCYSIFWQKKISLDVPVLKGFSSFNNLQILKAFLTWIRWNVRCNFLDQPVGSNIKKKKKGFNL